GIDLEDISAPWCFEIENRLVNSLKIPVFHDDQHGTAIVVLAGLINSARVLKRDLTKQKVVINGAGAAGIAVGNLLRKYGIKDILFCDRGGIISKDRENLYESKKELLKWSNKKNLNGSLADAMTGRDIFIGLSAGGILWSREISLMNVDPIIFAMANPIPEIMPDEAKKGGAGIIATGRSDFSNQINNVLVFPGIFRGALDNGVTRITDDMKLRAAEKLALVVKRPTRDKIIPSPFDKGVVKAVASAVK
ncbi:NADP-dependent malic enzyme, partial [Candidatus Dojkabacteria bacterium]|nr:NADP-dependent malic enzyme [Candidatus Dojkabacteria bacterium]